MKYEFLKQIYISNEKNKLYGYETPKRTYGGYLIKHVNNDTCYSVISSLNVQTSKYHKETLLDHVALVTYNMIKKCGIDKLAVTIAILHDIGKKYTIKVNNNGDICYYNHELVSAQLAVDVMNNGNYTPDEIKIVTAVIEAHLQLKLLKGIARECFIEGFTNIYGSKAIEYLVALDESDIGIANEEDIKTFDEDISYGYSIISDFVYL